MSPQRLRLIDDAISRAVREAEGDPRDLLAAVELLAAAADAVKLANRPAAFRMLAGLGGVLVLQGVDAFRVAGCAG